MWKAVTRWLRRRRVARGDELADSLYSSLATLVQRFEEEEIHHALMGGVAVVMHGVDRMTRDLDFIVERSASNKADAIMAELGFERLHQDGVFSNYLLGPLRIDLLFTQGTHSQRMLQRANKTWVRNTEVKVLCPEDLVGLKLQALASNPSRLHDKSDIAALIAKHAGTMDMALLRDYFRLFEKEAELDALLAAVS